jgi:two-component system chemotaxis response regulator CheY
MNSAFTALVVDDSAIIRGQLKRVLGAAGIATIAEAASANDLTALYEKHRPDLVTLDVVMPGRDGVTAAAELLAKHPDAKIVMCTSVTARDKILAAQKAGVKHYVLKPFDPERATAIFTNAVKDKK